jgi:hypothetical protein
MGLFEHRLFLHVQTDQFGLLQALFQAPLEVYVQTKSPDVRLVLSCGATERPLGARAQGGDEQMWMCVIKKREYMILLCIYIYIIYYILCIYIYVYGCLLYWWLWWWWWGGGGAGLCNGYILMVMVTVMIICTCVHIIYISCIMYVKADRWMDAQIDPIDR